MMVTMRKVISWSAAALLCSTALTAGATPLGASPDWPDALDGTPVFQRETGGFECYRIPAMVRAGDGSLLAFAEARRAHGKKFCADDASIDLVMRRSTDNGKTWSKMSTVLKGDPEGQNVGATRGNAVPIVVTQGKHKGRIVLLTTWNKEGDSSQRRPFVQYSDDHGRTWSKAKDITEEVKPNLPKEGWYATGPQHGIEIKNGDHAGRLVAGVNFEGPRGGLIYSDDGGETWTRGAEAPAPSDADHFSEVGVEETADGSLIAIGRTRKGEKDESTRKYSRAVAVSRDGGKTFDSRSFTFQEDLVTTPEVQGSIVNVDQAAGRAGDRLIYAAPQHGNLRKDLGLFVSDDGGTSWKHAVDMTHNRSGYSDMTMLDESTVGVLYETGLESGDARDTIVFDTADLED